MNEIKTPNALLSQAIQASYRFDTSEGPTSYVHHQLGLNLTALTVHPALPMPETVPNYDRNERVERLNRAIYDAKRTLADALYDLGIEQIDTTEGSYALFTDVPDGSVLYAMITRGVNGDSLFLADNLAEIAYDFQHIPDQWEFDPDSTNPSETLEFQIDRFTELANAFRSNGGEFVEYTPDYDFADTHTLCKLTVRHSF